jgi:lysophospholipase L1-like esterase
MAQSKLRSQRILWLTGWLALIVSFCLSRPGLLELFPPDHLNASASEGANVGSMLLGFYAIACLVLSRLRFDRLSPSLVLALAVFFGVLLGFEAGARPFIQIHTTIFARDLNLGWRLRPDTSDSWLGVDVEINELGMRGPLPRASAEGTVLFLGDSVTFGAFLERDAQTIPAMAQASLDARGLNTECLNGGVGGWSTWQEEAWLSEVSESLKPDIVVVNLVLNDATESLGLGDEDGSFQLNRSIEPSVISGTTWANALRSWRRKVRGEELRKEATERSELGVYELLRTPELPLSRAAWSDHMLALESLVKKVKELGAVPVVVAHPYTVQFEVPGLWWPQTRYMEWCHSNGVVYLNAAKALEGQGSEPVDYYHDGVHPNKRGAALIGRAIAALLVEQKLLP